MDETAADERNTDEFEPAVATPPTATSLPARLRAVYETEIGPGERALMLSWASFTTTFGAARVVTHALRKRGGVGGIVIGKRHLHHYNFGIATLMGVGGVAVHATGLPRHHPVLATAFGAGVALILDELALLLDLQDVYWAKDGRTSVDVAIGVVGLGGLYLAAVPFWHGAAREVAKTRPPMPSRS